MRTMRLVFISAIVATAFITTTVGAVSPVNYPVSPPGGEEEGGYFGRFFKNMYENPCSNSGAIVRFRNTGTLYNTGNLIPECGYPLASGIAGNVFTIGSGVTSTITNAIGPQGGLVIRGNNSPGTHTVRIENDLRVTGNTYLSGHIYGDLDANFRDVHVRRNLSVSGATNLTDLNVSGQTTLNRLNVTGPTILNTLRVNSGAVFGGDTIFEGDINISGALRAKK